MIKRNEAITVEEYRLKKNFSLFSVIFFSISILLGCTPILNEDLAKQVEEDIELAQTFIDLLDQGDFAAAHDLFDGTMQEELPEETLEEIWQHLIAESGNFIEHELDDVDDINFYLVVTLKGEFEELTNEFQLTIDSNSQIAGFTIN